MKLSRLDDYLKQRKNFIIVAGIALLVGAILKGFVLVVMLVAMLIYFILKRKGDKKSENVKDADTSQKEEYGTK